MLGVAASLGLGILVLGAKASGTIPVPGYAATVLTIIFFGGLNCAGLGIIGGYVWRTFENSMGRPSFIVASHEVFPDGRTGIREAAADAGGPRTLL